jgi:hypothetical protein
MSCKEFQRPPAQYLPFLLPRKSSFEKARGQRLWKKSEPDQFMRDLLFGPIRLFLSQASTIQLASGHAHLIGEPKLLLA